MAPDMDYFQVLFGLQIVPDGFPILTLGMVIEDLKPYSFRLKRETMKDMVHNEVNGRSPEKVQQFGCLSVTRERPTNGSIILKDLTKNGYLAM